MAGMHLSKDKFRIGFGFETLNLLRIEIGFAKANTRDKTIWEKGAWYQRAIYAAFYQCVASG